MYRKRYYKPATPLNTWTINESSIFLHSAKGSVFSDERTRECRTDTNEKSGYKFCRIVQLFDLM